MYFPRRRLIPFCLTLRRKFVKNAEHKIVFRIGYRSHLIIWIPALFVGQTGGALGRRNPRITTHFSLWSHNHLCHLCSLSSCFQIPNAKYFPVFFQQFQARNTEIFHGMKFRIFFMKVLAFSPTVSKTKSILKPRTC